MTENSLSVTGAARVLSVSVPTVKRMAADGEIETFRTPGGHLRVTAESVERLREGGTKEARHREASSVLKNRRERVEEVSLEAQELRAQRDLSKLRKESAEEAERDRQEMLQRERERRIAEERMRLEQERRDREQQEAEQRHRWENAWLRRALDSLPEDCPREYRGPVCQSVGDALRGLDPKCADYVVQELIGGIVEESLRPWRRDKEIEKVIEEAEQCLPPWARGLWEPTEWQIKLRRMVKQSIAKLGEGADVDEIRDAAIQAGQALAPECSQAKEAARREREKQAARQDRGWTLQWGLIHVDSYISQLENAGEIKFDSESRYRDRERLIRKLKKRIQPELLQEIEDDPDLEYRDVEEIVEDLVDEFLPEFVEED